MISVCLASYNGESFIEDQIKSILTQLSFDDELIISDDSSTDATVEIIKSFSDVRLKLFDKNLFRNPVQNFQNALKHSKGDIIFLCDQDDIWLEGKVSCLTKYLTHYDLVTSDCQIVNEKLNVISDTYLKSVDGRTGLIRNLFLKTSPYIGCCMAFNRKVLEKSLPFPKRIRNHDYWIAMVAEAYFATKIIYHPYVLYRRHDQNVSNTGKKSVNSVMQKLIKRKNVIVSLIGRCFK
jgi:glycosyltransferase involved in cell wall biosynthesis